MIGTDTSTNFTAQELTPQLSETLPTLQEVDALRAQASRPTVVAEQVIIDVASRLHDLWREPRRLAQPTPDGAQFEPRIKNVNGVDYDIANLSYTELPEKFQYENRESARVAVERAVLALLDETPLDAAFVEEASDVVHRQWMERNGSWAPPEQMKPYEALPEDEKEKDRVIVRAAIDSLNAAL